MKKFNKKYFFIIFILILIISLVFFYNYSFKYKEGKLGSYAGLSVYEPFIWKEGALRHPNANKTVDKIDEMVDCNTLYCDEEYLYRKKLEDMKKLYEEIDLNNKYIDVLKRKLKLNNKDINNFDPNKEPSQVIRDMVSGIDKYSKENETKNAKIETLKKLDKGSKELLDDCINNTLVKQENILKENIDYLKGESILRDYRTVRRSDNLTNINNFYENVEKTVKNSNCIAEKLGEEKYNYYHNILGNVDCVKNASNSSNCAMYNLFSNKNGYLATRPVDVDL
jgi:hypothetical protein